ncbi:hypothetical protein GBV73_02630 [Thermococcus sp. 101 C5]|nr:MULTISPECIES: hypothetical protein [unclassified Thermococcus]MCA6214575.1 hypothetical protein [Thermococcus bergensis]MPW38596.1 hypothetical protein [Thermococcus sp. 101 C5]HIH72366.1 hypothetical protein [Thermococcaceae archaeon]
MNPLYLALSVLFILLTIYFNKSNQRAIGIIASGFAGGFAFLFAFEKSGYSPFLVFAGGFAATVFFEFLKFRLVQRD